MPEQKVHHRKKRSKLTKSSNAPPSNGIGDVPAIPTEMEESDEEVASSLRFFWRVINLVLGLTFMCILAYKHATYMDVLHENQMWFSNIKEVEREISFRTESGLYYSYYKQFLKAPSISQGLYELTHDNVTEHLRTINVLARFNIYQEVVLGIMYRSLPFIQRMFEPVYFYMDSIFFLHGLLVAALYIMAWLTSSSWLAGVLAVLFYIFNKEDTTRVEYVIPLRESFSLPFIWIQLALITYYFKSKLSPTKQRLVVPAIFLSTLGYCVTWQFNQFVALLQAMALFGVQALDLVPHHKVLRVYGALMGSLFLVCLMQYFNTMILAGAAFSFMPAAMVVMAIQHKVGICRGYIFRPFMIVVYICLVFIFAAIFNTVIKMIFPQEADEHIYKFVLTKFGLEPEGHDFNVNLYLCNGAFEFLDASIYQRMTGKLAYPLYAVFHAGGLLTLLVAFLQQCRSAPSEVEVHKKTDSDATGSFSSPDTSHVLSERPALAFHLIQSVFFGCMAITTLRMKYLWTPYMCIMAAVLVADRRIWTWVLARCNQTQPLMIAFLRHGLTILVLCVLLYVALPGILKELEDLREFYDPDTVELMEWIKKSTPVGAAFTGSMQLLAGVKLSTERPLTNHPHFEDKVLRDRTKELYQIYAKRSAAEVHDIMVKYNVSYIILEDSICRAPSRDGCRLPDLLDRDNGMIPDSGKQVAPGLVASSVPRFCETVRHAKQAYGKLFKAVMHNKTFRIYKVIV